MTAGRRPRRPDRRLRGRGFTLIELLIVIVILGLLLSLVAPAMFSKVGSSQRKTAMAQMQMLSTALEAPVTIGELRSGFEGYRPSLRARAVRIGGRIGGTGDAVLSVEEVSAVLSLRALVRGEAGLAALELSRPVIRVERID